MVGLFSVFIFTKIKIENGPENMFSLLFENIFIKNAFRMRPTFEKIKKVVFYISVFMLTKKKFSVFKICKWKCPKCTLVRYRCLSFCPFRCGTYVLTNRTASPIHVPLSLSLSSNRNRYLLLHFCSDEHPLHQPTIVAATRCASVRSSSPLGCYHLFTQSHMFCIFVLLLSLSKSFISFFSPSYSLNLFSFPFLCFPEGEEDHHQHQHQHQKVATLLRWS